MIGKKPVNWSTDHPVNTGFNCPLLVDWLSLLVDWPMDSLVATRVHVHPHAHSL